MSNFSRFINVAKQAKQVLDSRNSAGTGAAAGAPAGQTDWRQLVRSAADAITGDGRTASTASTPVRSAAAPVSADDRAAIARYDYLLQTADPAAIEQVHREAFERLTPAQREQIEQRMRAELPEHERPRSAEPGDLARTATRAEVSRPGMLKGLLARVGGGGRSALLGGAAAGVGVAAGGMLAAVAGGAILSSVAGPLLDQAANIGVDFDALGGALDLEGLTGGLGESVSGLGEQVSGLGEQVGGWNLPGLDDLLGR